MEKKNGMQFPELFLVPAFDSICVNSVKRFFLSLGILIVSFFLTISRDSGTENKPSRPICSLFIPFLLIWSFSIAFAV